MSEFDIYKRCEDFSVQTINLLEKIPYRTSVSIITNQMMRSATSIGANLCEADNGRSSKEFLSYLGISLREIKETIYWFKILKRTNLSYLKEIDILENESLEIKKYLEKSIQKSIREKNVTQWT